MPSQVSAWRLARVHQVFEDHGEGAEALVILEVEVAVRVEEIGAEAHRGTSEAMPLVVDRHGILQARGRRDLIQSRQPIGPGRLVHDIAGQVDASLLKERGVHIRSRDAELVGEAIEPVVVGSAAKCADDGGIEIVLEERRVIHQRPQIQIEASHASEIGDARHIRRLPGFNLHTQLIGHCRIRHDIDRHGDAGIGFAEATQKVFQHSAFAAILITHEVELDAVLRHGRRPKSQRQQQERH